MKEFWGKGDGEQDSTLFSLLVHALGVVVVAIIIIVLGGKI